ncbi:MAG TPA: outer membrane beta-barrel protein [Terriglobales bacterium]
MKTLLFYILAVPFAFCQETQNPPSQTEPVPADTAAQAPAPAALPTPSITGPLQGIPPAIFNAGPFGKLAVNGVLSGFGMVQGNHVAGDDSKQAALSNGQVFIQKTDGWFQFYVQAGAYNLPALGTPFLATDKAVSNLYGPVPVAFLKLQPGKNTSIQVGALPTLMGAEYTFTFENMNISRGLLWNQENAVNRGIQVNQTMGKFTASMSWNDGFYSNRYSWLSGSLTYASGPHSLAFVGMGNLAQTKFQSLATPVQNNGTMYAVLYTFNKAPWIIQPYWQYTNIPTNPSIGVVKGATTNAAAILVSRTFKHGFSLPARFEYIKSSGSASDQSVNLMYGPGSSGTSITVTPTYQHGGFFVRGELAYVHAGSIAPGSAFGSDGTLQHQTRAMAEFGFIFGNNIR